MPYYGSPNQFLGLRTPGATRIYILRSSCQWGAARYAIHLIRRSIHLDVSTGLLAAHKARYRIKKGSPPSHALLVPIPLRIRVYRSSRAIEFHGENINAINALANVLKSYSRYRGCISFSSSTGDAHIFFNACSGLKAPSLRHINISFFNDRASATARTMKLPPSFSAAITQLDLQFGAERTLADLKARLQPCTIPTYLTLNAVSGNRASHPSAGLVGPVTAIPSLRTLRIGNLRSLHGLLHFRPDSLRSFTAAGFYWNDLNTEILAQFVCATTSLESVDVGGQKPRNEAFGDSIPTSFLHFNEVRLADVLPHTASHALARAPTCTILDVSAVADVPSHPLPALLQYDVVEHLRITTGCFRWMERCTFQNLRNLSLWSEDAHSHAEAGPAISNIAATSPFLRTRCFTDVSVAGYQFIQCIRSLAGLETLEFERCCSVGGVLVELKDPAILHSSLSAIAPTFSPVG
ncbi:hypothetical protein BOTBODRAFT_184305 [Botryobasidium botryosum FD-172 SS1]|uniref:F-box domain-containing protein n=1 Tax=Botryobasidium botryosum (strain FD-172 SS1) TaxID=930990 RepID=A0A067N618_BOTB1|nr:hypothetical protein BOTBODRAFT_184305 [Botryobasidium botryosum FD-172 SS1]